ncbi:MAG: phosphatase PAP2 family protein [Acetobacteraceae bacterium]
MSGRMVPAIVSRVATRLRQRPATTRAELLVLLGVLVGALGVFAFVALSGEVLEGDTLAFDRYILLALRSSADLADPIGPSWLELVARDITSLGGYSVLGLATVAVLGYLLLARKRASALLVVLCVLGGWALSSGLKLLFQRPRPDIVPHAVATYTPSFPSQHAMLSAVVYLTLGALLMRVMPDRPTKLYVIAIAVLLTLMVGSSRVYLGVHWPTDVLAGWCLGAAWALTCWMVALWLQGRGTVEPPPTTPPV